MSDSAYRLLLRALPADLRRDFGDDMVQLFRDQRQVLRGQRLRSLRLWLAATIDVLREAIASRDSAWPRPALSWRLLMRSSLLDVRHGLRLLRRYPGSSVLAIATLALGIGANTAIYSVVDRVLIRALPYPEPDRLVMLFEKRPAEGVMDNVVSAADYLDWRRQQTSFEHIAAFYPASLTLTGDGEPVQLSGAAVGWSFFDVLDVEMQRGRPFRAEAEVLGNHRVVVLSHGLWQRRYGGDPDIVGRSVIVNGRGGWQVIGVLPHDFTFVSNHELFVPLVLETPESAPTRVLHDLVVYARLKPPITLAQAIDDMDRIGRQLEERHPDENRGHGAHVIPMRERYVGPVRDSLVILLAGVGTVLLIACVNIASLLLVRAAARRREMAVRAALGASRGRLIVLTLTESFTLSLAGGAAGIAVALGLVKALPIVMPDRLSVVAIGEVGLDTRVLLFAVSLSLLTGFVFGLLPALHASRPDLIDTLNDRGRGADGVRRGPRRALVIGEIALAALALVGAGLVMRSFAAIMAQPLGFDPDNRLTLTVSLPAARYATPPERQRALTEIETRLAALPGVRSAGAITLLPLGGGDARAGVVIEGREGREGDPPTRMHPRAVTPGYFKTMSIPILRGRGFDSQDDAGRELVVIVTQAAVKRFLPDVDPIGQRVRFTGDDTWRTIVGVAGDVRHWGLMHESNPMLYLPQAQRLSSFLTFVLATHADPAALGAPARQAIAGVDPNLPLGSVSTLEEVVSRSLRAERAQMVLMGSFGILALVLAVIGIYGVTSQLVVARRHEIGTRMTLGARPRDILRQLLGEGLWQSLAGLAIGLAAGIALMRLGASMLYEVRPWDPPTIAAVSALLLAATLVAVLIPARRAMAVDPASTLRSN